MLVVEVQETALNFYLGASICVYVSEFEYLLNGTDAEAFVRFLQITNHSVSFSASKLSHDKYCLVLPIANCIHCILTNLVVDLKLLCGLRRNGIIVKCEL